MNDPLPIGRRCFLEPISEIADAARYLDAAVSAHIVGRSKLADELIRLADMSAIREWTESLWGGKHPHRHYRPVPQAPPGLPKEQRVKARMPTSAEKKILLRRDGYHCRLCGIPLIRAEIRKRIQQIYPSALPYGRTNVQQHAAFQAMCVQYDHLLAHARGGANDLENMLITCAPCNYCRAEYTFAEVGLLDPLRRKPVSSTWDGLERFRNA